MLDLDKFKQRIKERCAHTGVSQAFLCEKVGRQRTYLNNIWRGATTPSDDDMQCFAELLSTTPAYLKGETDDPKLPGEPETWTVPNWVGEIKKDPRKEGIMQRMVGMKAEDLLKLEKIMDMILGEK